MGIERRLERLEANASSSEWAIPIEVRIHTKAVARHQAREDGREPPPYTQEEIEGMRREDLEVIAGGGVVGHYRESKGWESEGARELLDTWEGDAYRRLEAAEGLPPDRWGEVWGADEDEGEEEELHDE